MLLLSTEPSVDLNKCKIGNYINGNLLILQANSCFYETFAYLIKYLAKYKHTKAYLRM